MQTPEQLKATAQTLIELAERLEKEKEAAGPWRPKDGERFWYANNDGARWLAAWCECGSIYADAVIPVGNCYLTESEAQDVADQRNFIERCLKAGDVGLTDIGYDIWVNRGRLEAPQFKGAGGLARKFSTEAKARAFVDSEGGEAEFIKKFSRGWV